MMEIINKINIESKVKSNKNIVIDSGSARNMIIEQSPSNNLNKS